MTTAFKHKILFALILGSLVAGTLFFPQKHAEAACVTVGSFVGFGGCTMSDVSGVCQGGGTCDDHDKSVLSIISAGCNDTRALTCSAAQQQDANAAKALMQSNPTASAAASCGSTYESLTQPDCWLRTATTWFSASLIYVAVTIMVWIGWLFNLAISQTVIGFNGWITGSVLDAISLGWGFFRDIANIVIIGLFVFIAIGIILGLKEYGQKKLIARVLIVAVLINFSFLFTRIIINFSNALAVQFAQPLGAQPASATQGAKPPDIAGKFTDLMGVKTWGDTKDALTEIAKKNDSPWISLMHAFLVAVVALGVALVLLYGAILLIMRALIFIFLMVTSSMAFATYLLPSLAGSEFGWKAWWSALFRNAMLAPIMMLFLFITLKISSSLVTALGPSGTALGKGAGGASASAGGLLGALASSPDDPKNISALLIYVVVLGLLYGSIRIANKFSGAAGQFALAGTLPFANAAVAWPARSLGLFGRNTIGFGAKKISDNFQERARAANARNPGGMGQFAWNKLSDLAKRPAKADFNVGNLTGVKAAQTRLGGYVGQGERMQKAGLERAERNTYKDAELEKARNNAISQARKENPDVAKQHDANQATLEAAKKAKEAAEAQLKSANARKEGSTARMEDLKAQQAKANDQGAKDAIQKQIAKEAGEFKKAGDDIDRAKDNARAQSSRVVQLETGGKGLSDILEKHAQALMPKGMSYKPEVDEAGKTKSHAQRVGDSAAEDVYKRISNMIPRAMGLNTRGSDKLSKDMRGKANDAQQLKELRKLAGELGKVNRELEKQTTVDQKSLEKDKETLGAIKDLDHKAGEGGGAPEAH